LFDELGGPGIAGGDATAFHTVKDTLSLSRARCSASSPPRSRSTAANCGGRFGDLSIRIRGASIHPSVQFIFAENAKPKARSVPPV
jgi:hypothetical protein